MTLTQEEEKYLKILNLPFPFSDELLKKNYKKLTRECHPDMHINESEEEQKMWQDKMQEINKAYEYLKERFKGNEKNSFTNSSKQYEYNNSTKKEETKKSDELSEIEKLCNKIQLTQEEASECYIKTKDKNYQNVSFKSWLYKRVEKFNVFNQTYDMFDKKAMVNNVLSKISIGLIINMYLCDLENNQVTGNFYEWLKSANEISEKLDDEMFFDLTNYFYSRSEKSFCDWLSEQKRIYQFCEFLNIDPAKARARFYTSLNIEADSFYEYIEKMATIKAYQTKLRVTSKTFDMLYNLYTMRTRAETKEVVLKEFIAVREFLELSNNYDLNENNYPSFLISAVDLKNRYTAMKHEEFTIDFSTWLQQQKYLMNVNCNSFEEVLTKMYADYCVNNSSSNFHDFMDIISKTIQNQSNMSGKQK